MNAFETAVTNPAVARPIGAAFYVATYLTFVRLMRFPRNWLRLSLPEVAVTGLLAVLAVAWVSLSPNRPELFSLAGVAVATGFFAMVLLIIAAPSIACRPTNAAVEFLAKHAEYAGLWLLGPALMAGLMLTAGLLERGARDGYYVYVYQKEDFVLVAFDRPRPWPFRRDRNRLRGEIRVDIAVYRPAISHDDAVLERKSHKGDMPATESGG